MPILLSRVLFGATCVAVLVSGWLGYEQLPTHFEPRPNHPGWEGRYAALSEALTGVRRALYIQEDEEGGSHRYFRAQFVLVPVILHRGSGLDSVTPRQIAEAPLILDYYTKRGLSDALQRLRREASDAGLEVEVVRGRGHLALVRARRTVP